MLVYVVEVYKSHTSNLYNRYYYFDKSIANQFINKLKKLKGFYYYCYRAIFTLKEKENVYGKEFL